MQPVSFLRHNLFILLCVFVLLEFQPTLATAQVLDKSKLLQTETFWDNRDFNWFSANIPFFECPDKEITTTYYYRWDLLTKHLTYGSPNSGYSFTEFIDRPFWSGTYGAISCPAGLQFYEWNAATFPPVTSTKLRIVFTNNGNARSGVTEVMVWNN